MGSRPSSPVSPVFTRTTMPARWFPAHGPESKQWVAAESGFGPGRSRGFRASLNKAPYLNRLGNIDGDIGGVTKVYTRTKRWTDYSCLPDEPRVVVWQGTKVFGKVFLPTPLGRVPVGENMLGRRRRGAQARGSGPVLLACVPRAVALFVEVDGKAYPWEVLCEESVREAREAYADGDYPVTQPTAAIPGSFVTYIVNRAQDDFHFVHLPLLAKYNDCLTEAGEYGVTVARAFHKLCGTLQQGQHHVRLKLRLYYDHSEFYYFPLNVNRNALGLWYSGLANESLAEPHPDPHELDTPEEPLTDCLFTLVLPHNFKVITAGWTERCVPNNKFKGDNGDEMRKEIKTIAEDYITYLWDVEGAPDCLVLTSSVQERRLKDEPSLSRYEYEFVEFVACWVHPRDPAPTSYGVLFEGSVVRGEVRPGQAADRAWRWQPRVRGGRQVPPRPIPVLNLHITTAARKKRGALLDVPATPP